MAIARSTGDQKWENRATGQLGIIAGVNGDLGRAAVALQTANAKAGALHDAGAQVYFITWLANGMTVQGMADRALPLIDRALDIVKTTPEAGFQFNSTSQRFALLYTCPTKLPLSRKERKHSNYSNRRVHTRKQSGLFGAETKLLNQAGLLTREEHANGEAEKYFTETASVAQ